MQLTAIVQSSAAVECATFSCVEWNGREIVIGPTVQFSCSTVKLQQNLTTAQFDYSTV